MWCRDGADRDALIAVIAGLPHFCGCMSLDCRSGDTIMNDPISNVTYWILWAGVAWAAVSLLRIAFLTIFKLRGPRQLT